MDFTGSGQVEQVKESEEKIFASHVSVDGFWEIYDAETRNWRNMWITVLLTLAIGSAWNSHAIANRYMGTRKTVVDTNIVFGKHGPYPNVSVCVSSVMDVKKAKSMIIIPQRIEPYLNKLHVDHEIVLDKVVEFMSYNLNTRTLTEAERKYALAITQATLDNLTEGYMQFLKNTFPTCKETLKNCQYAGQKFDCCSKAQFLYMENSICYQFSLHVESAGSDEPSRWQADSSGITLDISVDPDSIYFWQGDASTGIHVYFGAQATLWGDPVAIPFGMDARIMLKPANRLNQATNCHQAGTEPRLLNYEYFDPYGTNCIAEQIAVAEWYWFRCQLPYMTFSPRQENICIHAAQLDLLTKGLTGQFDVDADQHKQLQASEKKRSNDRNLFYNPACSPVCTRWLYEPWSASYSELPDENLKIRRYDQIANTSRIRIYFGDPMYEEHLEKETTTGYLALCEIGGALGLFLGLSMVTIFELIYYGAFLIRAKIFKNRQVQDEGNDPQGSKSNKP